MNKTTNQPQQELARLSASRIKTLGECSYYYFARYHLKLPDKQNSGASRGSVVHDLFELLAKPKWIDFAKKIHDEHDADVTTSPLICRFLRAKCRKYNLEMMEEDKKAKKTHIKLIYEMIAVGLKSGFFPADGESIIDSEYAFDITDEKLKFRIVGFIDKLILQKDGSLLIQDFKSSKEKFKGEDLETNLQAMMYILAAQYLKEGKKLPDFKKAMARFIFLRFGDNPYQSLEFTDQQIDGFRHYLSYLNEIISNFSENDAGSDYAADDPARRWKCSTKSGWKCAYKDPFEYYVLMEGETPIRTAFEDQWLETERYAPLPDNQRWEKKLYAGCPAHQFPQLNNQEHFDF